MPQDKKFINQSKLKKDLKFGLGQEVIIKDVLEKQFDTKLSKLPHFDPFDFNCNDGIYYWELYDYDKQVNKEFIFAEGGRDDRNCNEKEILVNLNTNLLKLID